MREKEVGRDITPLLTSLVAFEDDDRGAGTKAAILMGEGDTTRLEGDTANVWLVAIFFEMPAAVAQLTDTEEGAELNAMPLAHAPSALVAQPLVRPVPWTVDGLLDPNDVARIEGRCGRGEGVGDVAAEASVGVRSSEMASGLPQTKAIVCKLFPEVGQLPSVMSDLGACGPVADDFRPEGVVVFLLKGPVNSFGVRLSFGKEELLSPVE